MCGRYRLTAVDRIRERLGLDDPDVDLRPRYNIAPSQPVPIVRQLDGLRILSMARWGLVPFWAKDVSIGDKMINARSETVMRKPSFKQTFARRRCLIPADAFYEWMRDGTGKRPFDIEMKDGSVFAFAGLWDSWKAPEGAPVESCTILTTAANSLVSELHDRMPVILRSMDQSRADSQLMEYLGPAVLHSLTLFHENLQPAENVGPATEASGYFGMSGQSTVLMFHESVLPCRLQLPTNRCLQLGGPACHPCLHEKMRRIDLNIFAGRLKWTALAIDRRDPPRPTSA
jgi:putative SOS response-associated peptidase YedK